MTKIDDVAAALLASLGSMTTMKLEKLVYFAQATHLRQHGTFLLDDDFQAWRDGPVARHLYNQHPGVYAVSTWPSGNPDRLDADARATVAAVIARYGDLSPVELSDISHRELPWRKTRDGIPAEANSERVIDRALMAGFYRLHASSTAHGVAGVVASAELEGAFFAPPEIDSVEQVIAGERSADDVIAAYLAAAR